MTPRLLALLLPLPLLAACASTGATTTPGPAASVPTPVRTPIRRPPPSATIQTIPGVEGLIGADRAALIRGFGPPRLDVWEGDARKLQWTGQACVLDVYLYPKSAGAEPQATYVDARRPSDGRDVDRAACIAALKK